MSTRPAETAAVPCDHEHDDMDLIGRLAARDASALNDLYSKYSTIVFSLACRICRDRGLAEEATQNTFVQAWLGAGTFDSSRGTLRGWLLMIARARSLDRLRAERSFEVRRAPLEGINRTLSSSSPSPEAQVAESESGSQLGSVMSVLAEEDRHLLDLAFFQGLTHTELAARLDQPLGTVKTRMRRVLRMLRRAIADDSGRPFAWPQPEPNSGRPAALHGVHVLVVDDDASTLQLTTLVLERAGAQVVSASSAAMARRRLDAALPDLLVTDLEMPDEDGYSLLEAVRQRLGGGAIPAVAFTAHDEAADRDKTRRAGFALHIPKPVAPVALVDRLEQLVHCPPRGPELRSAPA